MIGQSQPQPQEPIPPVPQGPILASKQQPPKNPSLLFQIITSSPDVRAFKLDKTKGTYFSDLKKEINKLKQNMEQIKEEENTTGKTKTFEETAKTTKKIIELTESLTLCQKKLKPFEEFEKKFWELLNTHGNASKLKKYKKKEDFTLEEIKDIFKMQELLNEAADWLKSNKLESEKVNRSLETWANIHNSAKKSLKSQIDTQKKSFQDQLKSLNSTTITPEDRLTGTFQLAAELQSLIVYLDSLFSKDPTEKNKYLQQGKPSLNSLYEEVSKLMSEVQNILPEEYYHFSATAAAEKGQALQKGIATFIGMIQSKSSLPFKGVTANEVYLLKEKSVAKKSNVRAAEEENIISHLFNLTSKKGVLNSFSMQNTRLNRFGIQVSSLEERQRGVTIAEMDSTLRYKIITHSSLKSKQLWYGYYRNLEKFSGMEWAYKDPKKNTWETISFKKLYDLTSQNTLPEKALFKMGNDSPVSLKTLMDSNPDLEKALQDFPAQSSVLFIPHMGMQDNADAYEKCEKCRWTYTHEGKNKESDFKTLQLLYIREPSLVSNIVPKASKDKPTTDELEKALNIPWTMAPDVVLKETMEELIDFEIKPFLKDMVLYKKAADTPGLLKHIQDNLTSEAEFNAILTGELQFLDMHAMNIGFVPVANEEYNKYSSVVFNFPQNGGINFQKLLEIYVQGRLKNNTTIQFVENNQLITKRFDELPDLKKALTTKWELALFDTDLSLAEDNELQIQSRENIIGHLIPLRSALLQSDWKDKPLSKACIDKLLNSKERDERVKSWVLKEDAPILKRLSPTVKTELKNALEPIISRYSLTTLRINVGNNGTINDIVKEFANYITDLSKAEHVTIWKMLENELSTHICKKGDTLEKIAKRHKQDLDQLKQLNPAIKDAKSPLTTGLKVQLKYDLTSVQAVDERLKLAPQLFPRLTARQQKALFERQEKRTTYLKNHQNLQNCKNDPPELMAEKLKTYLRESTTPLSSIVKNTFLKEIDSAQKQFRENRDPNAYAASMQEIHQKISEACKPTYFNLMKAMYPLLADVFHLNMALSTESDAGLRVGLFAYTIQQTIQEAKLHPPNSQIHKLALDLEKKITQKNNPSFFKYSG